MVNAGLSLHIPLISFPERGGKLHVGFLIGYNPPFIQRNGTALGQGVTIVPDFVVNELEECSGAGGCNIDFRRLATPDGVVHDMGFTPGGNGEFPQGARRDGLAA